MFDHRVQSTPDAVAFYVPNNGGWASLTWTQVNARVRAIACGLQSLGIDLEQRCAIASNTRIEWILVDLGILCAGGATTTIYPSNTPEECAFIINDSGTTFAFVEDERQVSKLASVRENLPNLEKVIVMSGHGSHDGWVISLHDLEEMGHDWDKTHPEGHTNRVNAINSDHLATLIYTSGTTGRPKGVELTHDCWVFEAEAMNSLGFLTAEDIQYLWLPLSHSFGKVLESATIRIGIPTAIDGNIDRLVDNLKEVRPTFIAAVPRIFEKVYNKVVSNAKAKGGVTYRIFQWSIEVGRRVSALRQRGQSPTGLLALKYAIADSLVFSKIKNTFGGNVRFFISGSAPLSDDIACFFHAADILILEGYGLTETSAASFVNRPGEFRFGTVGLPLPGVEVQLDENDNEILLRGRGVMRGYYGLSETTAETLSDDGWLRTGDIGTIDDDNFLKIVDRKKDLIKTSGGKYVAPQKHEGKLKAMCPYISQVLVHGNTRNFCSALITLDAEQINDWAQSEQLSHLTYSDLVNHENVRALIQPHVDLLNADLARYETIKKFAILPQDFSIETGELTPSLKVKRKVVEEKYRHILDGFYVTALQDMTT